MAVQARFFLGANTPGGFYSLYGGFTDPRRDRLFILKGGPGCGKSTFMKRLAAACQEAGRDVEVIHCSGDPESLDGLYIPDLKTGYVDGTSPHVIEPSFAGSEGVYVNLGAFYDLAELSRHREEIAALTAEYKGHYSRAFRLLSAAAELKVCPALPEGTEDWARRRVAPTVRRFLRNVTPDGGGVKYRFLTGHTCEGLMALWDTVEALADKVYMLDSSLGLHFPAIEAACAEAKRRGVGVIRCQSPMLLSKTEHLIIPGAGIALISSLPGCPYPGGTARRVRLDLIPDRDAGKRARAEIRRSEPLRSAVMDMAFEALRDAKLSHDALEQCYIPAVDHPGLDKLTKRHIEALLG